MTAKERSAALQANNGAVAGFPFYDNVDADGSETNWLASDWKRVDGSASGSGGKSWQTQPSESQRYRYDAERWPPALQRRATSPARLTDDPNPPGNSPDVIAGSAAPATTSPSLPAVRTIPDPAATLPSTN